MKEAREESIGELVNTADSWDLVPLRKSVGHDLEGREGWADPPSTCVIHG